MVFPPNTTCRSTSCASSTHIIQLITANANYLGDVSKHLSKLSPFFDNLFNHKQSVICSYLYPNSQLFVLLCTTLLTLASIILSSNFVAWLSIMMPLYLPMSWISPFSFHIGTITPLHHSAGICCKVNKLR